LCRVVDQDLTPGHTMSLHAFGPRIAYWGRPRPERVCTLGNG
jgi:hypothetical protein